MNNSQRIWHALEQNAVDAVTYLPCNKLNALMLNKPEQIEVWNITKESAGLSLCFGRSLAGKRSAMVIQNTGLGNLITDLYTLHKLYQVALPIFVSWRGHYKEPIEAQVIFGEKVEDLLKAVDVEYKILATAEDLQGIEDDIARCYAQNKVKVYLLSPELWEQNLPNYHTPGQPSILPVHVDVAGYDGKPSVTRIGAIRQIMESVGATDIVLAQIGFPAKELYNVKDRPNNFYLLGALGAATEVGIGLAKSIAGRHVFVIDGDGALFFNPNQLLDIVNFNPANLTVICLDNGSWGSTGNQPTPSARGFNLSGMINALGVESSVMTDNAARLASALTDKVRFVHYLINPGNDKTASEIPLRALEIKQRFMQSIL